MKFVPQGFNPANWNEIELLFKELETRKITSGKDLENWLKDQSELKRILDQAIEITYIIFSIDTRDKGAQEKLNHITQEIEPKSSPHWAHLKRLFLDSQFLNDLPKRYNLLIKMIKNSASLFRKQNITFFSRESELEQKYYQIKGSQKVLFEGKELTTPQISIYLEARDRNLRQKAYEALLDADQKNGKEIDEMFNELVRLRHQISVNAGFENYRDYRFRALGRFDYTPKDCFSFHHGCEKKVSPLLRQLNNERRRVLGVDLLRPWDTKVDFTDNNALRPFGNIEELIQGCSKIFNEIAPEFGQQFKSIRDMGFLDLESRQGKMPGGFHTAISFHRLPFIFLNLTGQDADLRMLLHEAGHAFHALASSNQPIQEYWLPPFDFCEVASMTMELFGNQFLDIFYNERDIHRSRYRHFYSIIEQLPWFSTIDAYEHWIYENPKLSVRERHAYWLKLKNRFDNGTDISGYENAYSHYWQRIPHLFGKPFYTIEYGIAQLAALGIWKRSLSNFSTALRDYRSALALGRSVPLPQLFKTAGVPFGFGADIIGPLVDFVRDKINEEKKALGFIEPSND